MSRPKTPRICQADINDLDGIEVLQAPRQWVVTYKDELVSIVRTRLNINPKYLKTTYVTYAPAANMATKLNNLFDCEDFGVRDIQ